jgi:cation diffusion facilitator family transporter
MSIDDFAGPDRSKYVKGEKVEKISALLMVFLAIMKGSIGLLSGSVALMADAVNSLADIFASIMVWSGLRLAGRDPNERFPYGYYRGETLASFVVAIMIIIAGAGIAWQSAQSITDPTPIVGMFLPIAAALSSAIVYFILSKYKLRVGNEIGSPSLIADSKHSMLDVYAGVLVLAGVVFSIIGYPIIDIFVALLLAAYIMKEGVVLMRDSGLSLMDASPIPERHEEIRRVAEGVHGVVDVHDIKVRVAGSVYFCEMHATMSKEMPLDQAHALTDEMEALLKQLIPELESVMIHMEPEKKELLRVAVPISEYKGISSGVSQHFAKAAYFCIVEIVEKTVMTIESIENPGSTADKKRGLLAVESLVAGKGIDAVIATDIGRGAFSVLRSELVAVHELPAGSWNVESIIELFIQGELKRITEIKQH